MQKLLADAATAADENTFRVVIDAVLDESMPLEVPRAVLEYTASVVDARIADNAAVERIIDHALTQLRCVRQAAARTAAHTQYTPTPTPNTPTPTHTPTPTCLQHQGVHV